MARRVVVATEPSWMTRLEVTVQVEEEFSEKKQMVQRLS